MITQPNGNLGEEKFVEVSRFIVEAVNGYGKLRKALEAARENVTRIKEPYDGVTYDENGYSVGGTPVDVVDADDVMDILASIEAAVMQGENREEGAP